MFGPIIWKRFIESDKLTFRVRQVFRILSFICFVHQFRAFRVVFGDSEAIDVVFISSWQIIANFINNMRITKILRFAAAQDEEQKCMGALSELFVCREGMELKNRVYKYSTTSFHYWNHLLKKKDLCGQFNSIPYSISGKIVWNRKIILFDVAKVAKSFLSSSTAGSGEWNEVTPFQWNSRTFHSNGYVSVSLPRFVSANCSGSCWNYYHISTIEIRL